MRSTAKNGWALLLGLSASLLMSHQARALDENDNGIEDAVEISLASKFVPAVQLHAYGYNNTYYPVYPSPVEIMANKQAGLCCPLSAGDLWARYSQTGQLVHHNPVIDNFSPPLPFAHVGYAGGHPPGIPIYDYNYGNWDFDTASYVYDGTPPGHGHASYSTNIYWEFGGKDVDTPPEWLDTWHAGNAYTDKGRLFNPTVYVGLRVLNGAAPPSPGTNGNVLIQYYFFYPFNAWVNKHEGDWELVNVVVSSDDPGSASLVGVEYFMHKKFYVAPANGYVLVDGTHPLVFVGGHGYWDIPGLGIYQEGHFSHGSYPTLGRWTRVVTTWLNIPDQDDTIMAKACYTCGATEGPIEGPYVDWSDFDVIGINPNLRTWSANLPWGTVEVESYASNLHHENIAPRGPTHSRRWLKRASEITSEDEQYTLAPPYQTPKMGWVPFQLFHDSFNGKREDEDGDLDRWTLGYGQWSIVDGELRGAGIGIPMNRAHFALPSVWYDFPFEDRNANCRHYTATISMETALPTLSGAGLIVNRVDDQSSTRAFIDNDGGGNYLLRLDRLINGGPSSTTYASTPITNPGVGVDHHLAVTQLRVEDGAYYDVEYDGNLAVNSAFVEEPAQSDYGVFMEYNAIVRFDDINVTYTRLEGGYHNPPFAAFINVPDNGEIVYGPGLTNISWRAEDEKGDQCGGGYGIAQQYLELSTNGGASWSQIAAPSCGIESWDWTVPTWGTAQNNARLRLRVIDQEGDERIQTASAFTIISLSQANSSIVMKYANAVVNPYVSPAQIGGCPSNGVSIEHPAGTTSSGVGDYWIEVTLKNTANQPVVNFTDIVLDFQGCNATHYSWSSIVYPDAPTDANGVTRFLDGLNFGGADPCTFSIKVAGLGWLSYTGLRNVDISGNGCVALDDVSLFQQAFVQGGPAYICDVNLDNYPGCALGDLDRLNVHFLQDAPHGPGCPGARSGAEDNSYSDEKTMEDEAIIGNDLARLYLHIGERAREGAPPPSIPIGSAVTSVGSVEPGGRDMTIWAFVSGYSEMRGVHVRCVWPLSWQLEAVVETLPGQIFGHPDGYWRERGEFMTAFECIRNARPTAVGRFDVHVTEAGSVGLSTESPIARIVDCQERVTVLAHEREAGQGIAAEKMAVERNRSTGGPTLARIGSIVSRGDAEFLLTTGVATEVTARVYDVNGRVVAVLLDRVVLNAGPHSIAWDGMSSRGGRASSGIYSIEVNANGRRFIERIVMLR